MYDVRFVAWPAFVHPASPQSPTRLLDHSSWCAPPPPPAVAGVWQGDVSLSFESDLEGVGRRRIFDIPAKPGEPGLVCGGCCGWGGGGGDDHDGWAEGDRGGTDYRRCWEWCLGGEGRMGVGASTGWTIGAGGVGAGTGIRMGACKG